MLTVLIAAELRSLLDPDPVPGYAVRWIAAEEPTPAGAFVAIVPLLSRRISAAELDGLPALRVVANCAAGYDNVDVAAAARRGIVVTNTPDVLTEATADLTWALILAVARRLKEGQQLIASGRWTGWHPTQLLGLELSGATLGVVGAGRIGQAVGRRAVGFGMHIRYLSRTAKPAFERETGAQHCALEGLLAESQVITLHVPSSPETRSLINAAALERMPRGAILVNTARGEIVDEVALIAALEGGRLAGAGLDVFAAEPEVERRLIEHPRVVTLPHLGSATDRTRRQMAALAVQNALAVLQGKEAPNRVAR